MSRLNNALDVCPLIAILRGLTPNNARAVGQTLVAAGLSILEVPINSPQPFESICIMRESLASDVVLGAGTLMTPNDLEQLKQVGGELAIMPHTNPHMIKTALDLGLTPMPGVFTPTEAFTAIHAGAQHLKVFPANIAGLGMVKAIKAVLPNHIKLYAVGGITASSLKEWSLVEGFGIGGSLFKPNMTLQTIQENASSFHAAATSWKQHL